VTIAPPNLAAPSSRLSREEWSVLAALGFVTLLSWAYLFYDAARMADLPACCAIPRWSSFHLADLLMLAVMWTIMMVAMMLPSAAPMILLFARITRQRRDAGRPYTSTFLFASGYVIVWTAFSLAATLLQWGLHESALLSRDMASANTWFGGGLLLAAGIFQFTPLKVRCLSHCRSPMQFLMSDWREGAAGAITMGLRHGWHCLGCCWALMALLFVLGVMNLLWVAALTTFVLLEKIAPTGLRVGKVAGVLLIAWGGWVLVHG
jgi:predicted metal-binding membrane protein